MNVARLVSVVVVCAGASVACREPLTQPDSPPVPSFAYGLQLVGQGILASGGGILEVTNPPAAIGEAYFSFTVEQSADGTARGRFHMVRPRAGFIVDIEGEVTCLSADPAQHRVWVGGKVTRNQSTDPNHLGDIHQPGDDVWFRVLDNGEGAGALPDRSSVYGFEGAAGVITSAEYCALQLWPEGDANAFAVTAGNIQVQ